MSRTDKAKKVVAVIGYGSQGRAIALNLRDSGWSVVVGLRPRSKSRVKARADKFTRTLPIAEAVKLANIVVIAIPDHEHGQVFENSIAGSLRPKSMVVFLHGLSVHFGLVKPPRNCDVVLIAPHAPGVALREEFQSGKSVSAFVAVKNNPSKSGWASARKLAAGIGISRDRLVKTTFEHEAVGDIFGEQAVLCGGLAMLIKHGFDTLVSAGIPPYNAWLEVAYQLDLIVGLIKQYGIAGMFDRISVTARYGSLQSGPKILDRSVKQRMQKLLGEIKSGRFAKSLAMLTEQDVKRVSRSLRTLTSPALERAARKTTRSTR